MEPAETESMKTTLLRRLHSGERRYLTLRMAPMIDMVFLLLIFFLVAAKWRPKEDFLPLQLAAAQPQAPTLVKPEPLVIFIDATETGCRVQIGPSQDAVNITSQTIETDLVALIETMRQTLLTQKRNGSDPVEIVCAPEVKWEYLARIYNAFYGAGLTDITFRMTE
ncbi:MAG TPA: biopolymer transporter ExbD [Sedimentisphaerales bacterium]|nr:biopolymer transporter ExbD [Sedimentisphaerales bacterium]